MRYAVSFILIMILLLMFGCATVKQGYEDVTQKAKGAFSDEADQKPEVAEAPEDTAVVYKIKQFLPVKLAPSPAAKTVGKLYLDDKVTIDRETGRWFYVRQKDESGATVLEGWVVKDYVKRPPKSAPAEGENRGFVVDIENFLPVKTDPSKESKTIGKLYLGDKVAVDRQQEQWCYVARVDEENAMPLQGWVKKRYIEELTSREQTAGSMIELTYLREEGPSTSVHADDRHKDMKNRTKAEGAVAGAAVGALVGALVSDDKGKGALIGGVVGAAAGFAAGSYVAGRKEEYANDEEYLNAAIEEATRYNQEARQRNGTLEKVIAATEAEINVLKNKINDTTLRQNRAQENVRALTKIAKETEYRIAELQGLVKAQEEAINDIAEDTPHLKELQHEMEITRDQIEDLKDKRNQLETLLGEMAEQTV
jgi:uncharacterized protein YcfJ